MKIPTMWIALDFPPFWMLGTDVDSLDVVKRAEDEAVAELGVIVEPIPGLPRAYGSERDAARVCEHILERHPEAFVGYVCSDEMPPMR